MKLGRTGCNWDIIVNMACRQTRNSLRRIQCVQVFEVFNYLKSQTHNTGKRVFTEHNYTMSFKVFKVLYSNVRMK